MRRAGSQGKQESSRGSKDEREDLMYIINNTNVEEVGRDETGTTCTFAYTETAEQGNGAKGDAKNGKGTESGNGMKR